ncbi:MAG TPA: uroporphyrinogen-III C-methyltransferase [Actinomycetota bacterium]|nr:uroporphyrinogen-III C-methyltransferase [Actinomycetota bacterium]
MSEQRPPGLSQAPRGAGLVSLVGAGPGDPGLLTVRGKERLEAADAVVFDRLAHPDLLALAPVSAERIYIGKAYGRHVLEQEELNNLLVFLASQGKKVVRLKGGDPFVYGRGGEEAEALGRAGIPFEIVPGISSAVAAPAYAGIPVTDRRYASSVAFVTGHKHPDDPDGTVDWCGLATSVDTIVVLMGMRHPGAIAAELMRGGKAASTPVAVVEWGTRSEQRTLTTTLEGAADAIAREGYGSPSVIVVGEVVRLRSSLAWFEELGRAAAGVEASV